MAKLERIISTEEQPNGSTPVVQQPRPPQEISFDLARGKGVAVFRQPLVEDLERAEIKAGRISGDTNAMIDLCGYLADICCVKWGDRDFVPELNQIRKQDAEQRVLVFMDLMQKLIGEEAPIDEFCVVHEGTASNGFDLFEVMLSDGTAIMLEEPTGEDAAKARKSRTMTEQNIKLISALCKQWGSATATWATTSGKVKKLVLEDYWRLATVLNRFR